MFLKSVDYEDVPRSELEKAGMNFVPTWFSLRLGQGLPGAAPMWPAVEVRNKDNEIVHARVAFHLLPIDGSKGYSEHAASSIAQDAIACKNAEACFTQWTFVTANEVDG